MLVQGVSDKQLWGTNKANDIILMLGQPNENYVENDDVVLCHGCNADDYNVIQMMSLSCANAMTMSFCDIAAAKAMQRLHHITSII